MTTGIPILRGQVWRDEHGTFRVMATAENYAMVRRKGAAPFAIAFREINARCMLVDARRVRA